MKRYDLGTATIEELSEEDIAAVKSIAENALGSTYDAYHAADQEPPEEDEEDDHRPEPQFFGERGAAYRIIVDDEIIGGIFLSFDQFEPDMKTGTLCLLGLKDAS
ncbi:hypothetical protein [Xanthobacter flavus]|uniref:hypothetical protein n=1 Tax=Xanthobacter flavus TaxID=281 RepID=UPI003729F0CB